MGQDCRAGLTLQYVGVHHEIFNKVIGKVRGCGGKIVRKHGKKNAFLFNANLGDKKQKHWETGL